MKKTDFEILDVYNCHENDEFDESYGDCYEVIDKVYSIAKNTDIRFNSQESPFEAVIVNDEIVGGSVINEMDFPDTFSFSVVVDKNHQSKGLGKKLINNAIEYAKDLEYEKISLYVINENLEKHLSELKFKNKGMKIFEKKL